MRKIFSGITVAAIACLMAACGGSDDKAFLTPGGSPGGGGSAPVASVVTTTSVATIPADNSSGATITALVRDANNNALSGVTVAFASTAGSLVVTTAMTDANGNATGTLTAAGAAAGTQISVTASAGGQSAQVSVGVVNTQQSITLLTNATQIPSNNSTPATITAIVRNASNALLSGTMVTFSATSGAIVATQTPAGAGATPPVTAGTTDANGAAQAALSTPGDNQNRSITVTATAGTSSATIVVSVVGTKLTISGPASLIQGSQGTYTVSLVDSAGAGIDNQTVTLASANGNTLSAASVTTVAGQATFQVTAVNSGTDSITASALGLQASQKVTVSSQNFTFTAPAANASISLGQSVAVTVNWKSNGVPVAGQTVNFSATRGTLTAATAVTDANGNATVMISSSTSGPALLAASATGVSAQQQVSFVATTPSQIAIQASPDTIATQGQSTITAIVRDAQNNLVQGQTVNFALTDITGGQLSFASVTTDSEGVAQTAYTASTEPSTSNGVTVTATVQGTSISASTTLTVGGQTVFISLGTGNTIAENASKTQFQMPWVVQAVDSAGNPVNNVTITLTIHSSSRPDWAYQKGTYKFCGSAWVQVNNDTGIASGCPGAVPPAPVWVPAVQCLNEDINLTGVYEASEDTNNNGKLDPGDVAVATPGTLTTATDGSATFTVEYPEDHALWVQTTLTATATVQGTQSSTTSIFQLPMLATYLTNQTVDPPGLVSPYGVAGVCTNPN
jgi:hypothetical protein